METLFATKPTTGRTFYLWSVAAMVTACALITLMWVVLIWIFSPGPSIVVSEPPAVIADQTTSSFLAYQFAYCRERTGPVQLARELVRRADGDILEIVPLTETLITLAPGCHYIRMSLMTPGPIQSGTYTLRLSFIDVANPRRTTTAETDAFHVE